MSLIGDSSLITYKVTTKEANDHVIELTDTRFCDWVQREFWIENTGKVTFEYKVNFAYIKRKGYLECSPSMGRILG